MIWLSNLLLILSYWLLGRKNNFYGWLTSLLANLVWTFALLHRHQYDVMVPGIIFAVMATWNLAKVVREQRALHQPAGGF